MTLFLGCFLFFIERQIKKYECARREKFISKNIPTCLSQLFQQAAIRASFALLYILLVKGLLNLLFLFASAYIQTYQWNPLPVLHVTSFWETFQFCKSLNPEKAGCKSSDRLDSIFLFLFLTYEIWTAYTNETYPYFGKQAVCLLLSVH